MSVASRVLGPIRVVSIRSCSSCCAEDNTELKFKPSSNKDSLDRHPVEWLSALEDKDIPMWYT